MAQTDAFAPEYVPAVQFKHALLSSLECVPAGQMAQTDAFAPEYAPAAQFKHALRASLEYVPAAQARQALAEDAPAVARYVPAAQSVHVDAPGSV
jgi:hypothetical protein